MTDPLMRGANRMLAITLLGTGSPMPDPHRAGPATLVTGGTEQFLVDAGRGVLMRLGGAASSAGQLSAVLLTHLHSDHITDLNDVITSRWVLTFEPSPLTIVGPIGTRTVAHKTPSSPPALVTWAVRSKLRPPVAAPAWPGIGDIGGRYT